MWEGASGKPMALEGSVPGRERERGNAEKKKNLALKKLAARLLRNEGKKKSIGNASTPQ